MNNTDNNNLLITYSTIDRLYYIRRNGEDIHHQVEKPTIEEIREAYKSDEWEEVFRRMEKGERVRVSERIYWEMLGAVPPIRQTANSFYVGEPYNSNWHHYFEKVDGFYYGQLKQL